MQDKNKATPVPISNWDASLSNIIDDMKGRPLNVHSLMANHPELLKAWWNFRNYSVVGGELGKRGGELVILRVAVHMRAWYEWGSHVERALACGLSLDEIERVKKGSDSPEWSASDALLLKSVDELVTEHAINKATYASLQSHYSIKQIMDIIAIHGMYVILGCMINTWGLELDEHVKELLPEGVTKERFEAEFPRT